VDRPLPQPDSARYLYRIIKAVGAGSDLDAILRGVIQLVTDATGCHGCFVFFVQGEELVLRAASGVFAHAEGRVRLPTGQGLVGWAASTGRSVSIPDNALDDPRVLFVPELHPGEPFESMIAVPVVARSGATVAVIGMNTRAPRTYEAHEVEFLENAASLVAGAIENARLYEDANRQVGLLSALSDLARRIAVAASADELLSEVVSGCRHLLGADRCELYLSGPDHRLALRSASPPRPAGRLAGSGLIELAGFETPDGGAASSRRLGTLVWGPDAPGIAMGAPLVVGADRFGLLCALLPEPLAGGERVLAAIASHAAVAIKRHQLIESPSEDDVVGSLFQALVLGDAGDQDLGLLAARLRCDLAAPYVVAHVEPCSSRAVGNGRRARARPVPDWSEAAGRLERALRSHLPGSLFDRRDTLARALLPVPETGLEAMVDLVRDLHVTAAGGPAGGIATGLSDVTRGPATFAGRFAEAEATARLGHLLRGGAGVSTYEELGAYRYALGAEATVRDRYQETVGRLLDYGARRGVDLVGTLDAYLELRGSITHAARRLGIHPNTLRQRLARIDHLTALQVDRADWIALAMAVKTVRLRALRSRGEAAGTSVGAR
jgi:GAF domain-containing protein